MAETPPWDDSTTLPPWAPTKEEDATLPVGAQPIAYSPDAVEQAPWEDSTKIEAKGPKKGGWRDSIPRIIQIESGGDPNARTGKYTGLFQMGPDEIKQYGGNSYEHGVRLLEDRAAALTRRLGREPTGAEVYFAHQQGLEGSARHLENPDRPAWENMYDTGEGRKKGPGWAKLAIWGNIPNDMKKQFGSVENVTSADFTELWRQKVERTSGTRVASAEARPRGVGRIGGSAQERAPWDDDVPGAVVDGTVASATEQAPWDDESVAAAPAPGTSPTAL